MNLCAFSDCTLRLLWLGLVLTSCIQSTRGETPSAAAEPAPWEQHAKALAQAGLSPDQIQPLREKPLFKFTEAEVDLYLRYLQVVEPDLRKRIVHLARKNLGQPYELYLLGEMPFETIDPQPLYCLAKSDCLVYSEHTYAMALGHDWESFMALLQRIRYRGGQISVVTRNHYAEVDWNPSNRWLVREITQELAGDRAIAYGQRVDRAKFLAGRYKLAVEIPVEEHTTQFLPAEEIELAYPHLEEGDFVNLVRGMPDPEAKPDELFGGSAWVGHVGLVVRGPDGAWHMIHSTTPQVREQSFAEIIEKSAAEAAKPENAQKPRLLGFKFFRLEQDPLAKLREVDGPEAPIVTLPKGGTVKFR
jgi:hypothetical protein